MRKELNIFVDVKYHKPLDIKVTQGKNGQVISGALYNKNARYPIIRGIPRFVGKAFYHSAHQRTQEHQTAFSFGRKWNEKRHQIFGYRSWDARNLTEQFMAMLGCRSTAQLKDTLKKADRTLNAGCGVAWSEYLFNMNPHTERHCIDISLAVETAYEKTRDLRNIIVSQASIFALPYQDETFDLIYSLGVLHHTKAPHKAFTILAKKLKPGGLLGIYIYNKKPFLRELSDTHIRSITTKMSYKKCREFSKKMTYLGKMLSEIQQPLVIKKDIELLGVKKGTYSLQSFIYNHFVKCWYGVGQDERYADLVNQDWYHPQYASHHSKEEVFGWFRQAGIKRPVCLQPKGWEHSGFFISGRKND